MLVIEPDCRIDTASVTERDSVHTVSQPRLNAGFRSVDDDSLDEKCEGSAPPPRAATGRDEDVGALTAVRQAGGQRPTP